MVSRAERGVAPGMGLKRLVMMSEPLGRLFPLGTCPHDHECAWQPIKPPEHVVSDVERLLALLMTPSDEKESDSNIFEGDPPTSRVTVDD